MSAFFTTEFWGCIILTGVYTAADDPIFAIIWLTFGIIIFVKDLKLTKEYNELLEESQKELTKRHRKK